MKNIIETIFNRVFSLSTWAMLMVLLFGYGMISIILSEKEEQALAKATSKACYDGGLIKVDTDAGAYCVAPANLVKLK